MSRGTNRWLLLLVAILGCTGQAAGLMAAEYLSGKVWPEPKVINPGDAAKAPSDAIVLFDGKDMSQWNGGEKWIVKDGAASSAVAGITSKRKFGSCQVHVEFATPAKVEGEGQGRGNSGVYLMSLYEVQILDSSNNKTYFDGQCASIYKQWPPLVNASRKPGEWQTFDIVFEAPKFDAKGKLVKPACMTVLHNGVLVQNHAELLGASAWEVAPKYAAHPDKLPLHLQFHGNPVRFRNIWVREL